MDVASTNWVCDPESLHDFFKFVIERKLSGISQKPMSESGFENGPCAKYALPRHRRCQNHIFTLL